MLEFLRIRNFALINDLKIEFEPGFNVLTGETGAGKSIIIGALGIILGEKASTDFIRKGEEKAIIEAFFDIKNLLIVQSILKNSGIDFDIDEPLIIRREISVVGRNKIYINSFPVPLVKLRELGDYLVDIHGQHEHQSLFKVNFHIELLDKFGKLYNERKELEEKFLEYMKLKNRLDKLMMNEQEKNRLVDLLKFSINEIESANLKNGEDLELEKEYNILSNQEKIFQAIEESYALLYGENGDAYSKIGEAINLLADIEKYDSSFVSLKQSLEESYYTIEDVISSIRNYKESFNFSQEHLNAIIERMEVINKLKKKYGATIEEILNYKEKCINDLESIERSEEEIEQTKKQIIQLEEELNKLAIKLSGRRRVVAKLFEEKIEEQLKDLEMEKAKFKVDIKYIESENGIVKIDNKRYKLNEKGIDKVEFLIATNVGEELKPLRKIASGGEISRVMLALKTILNEVDNVETLIFDEIDVGIGGKTSDVVGKKLKFVSNKKQVIIITHQAQIARYADRHFVVLKDLHADRTITKIKEVKGESRVREIARMIGVSNITDTTLKHARELLALAK